MTGPHDQPNLDDVLDTNESAIPDRREHGKMPSRPNDDELAHRSEQERVELGLDDFDPDSIPSATE